MQHPDPRRARAALGLGLLAGLVGQAWAQFPNAQFTQYDPGRTFQLGVRGKF